ncbi:MAG: insulinase family protein [Bacteroidaceae bacterium]|nr:insulinase family protein [Bacteroidaceae bacterium]
MKRLYFILTAIISFAVSSATANEYTQTENSKFSGDKYRYESVENDPMQVRIYTLDNGLKVYLSVNKDKPRIYTNIAIHTGERNDPAETTGLSHYLEHIMFKGTMQYGTRDYEKEKPYLDAIRAKYEEYRKLTNPEDRKKCYQEIDSLSQLAAQYNIPNEYDKLAASIGADGTNAYTGNDQTVYVNDIPSNELEKWMKIESDRMQNTVIRGFHTELEAVYEEYNMDIAKDGSKMWKAACAKLFPNHPYGTQTIIGTQQHLKNPSILNIERYYKNYYCPNNAAIVLAGDLDYDRTIALIDKYFGSWKRNDTLSRPTFEPIKPITSPTDTIVYGQEAPFTLVGWQAKGSNGTQADTISLLTKILYNGNAGTLDLNVNQAMKCQASGVNFMELEDYSALILQGHPKEGQTNKEVLAILLQEIEKIKQGDFDESMITAVVNNMKMQNYLAIEDNSDRVSCMTDAFIKQKKWNDQVQKIDRISRLTKADIVKFANSFFKNNYAVIFKEQGNDTTLHKIDKPQITPIPANREYQSRFVADIINEHSPAITPLFPDYDKDITKANTNKGLPVLYVKNNTNGLFKLQYVYDLGNEAEPLLPYLAEYLQLIGTSKYSAQDISKKFYALACEYDINTTERETTVTISGLSENMPQAIQLYEHIIADAKADHAQYTKMIDAEEKERNNLKTSQKQCARALYAFGLYGKQSPYYRDKTIKELRNTKPEEILAKTQLLTQVSHRVLYYGPMNIQQLTETIDKYHPTATKPRVKVKVKVNLQQTPQNEIYLAPYDAKNIYMYMYTNEGTMPTASNIPTKALFNAYYSGGMNAIVFQEMRETRGLAYSAGANYTTPSYKDQTEHFITSIITQNDKLIECTNTFRQIIDTMPQHKEAFEVARQTLKKNLASERINKFSLLNSYLKAQRQGLTKSPEEITYNAIDTITLHDIADFVGTHIARKPYRYLILGNEKELDIKALQQIGTIKRYTLEQIFNF